MRVVQVNTADAGGGAERIAVDLHHGYRRAGWDAELWVGRLRRGGEGIRDLSGRLAPHHEPSRTLVRRSVSAMARPRHTVARLRGRDDFGYPETRQLLRVAPQLDAIQLHNLHGEYFDLRALPELSRRTSVALTLHDMWLATGHCAHSLDCNRWLSGCGKCPYPDVYPAIRRDGTRSNFSTKQSILARSSVYLTTPSQWLMDRMSRSMLAASVVDSRVIPNGVDTETFKPGARDAARHKLGLDPHAFILLVAGNGLMSNPFKDFPTLHRALESLTMSRDRLAVVAVGATGADTAWGSVPVRMRGFIDDASVLAMHYQAADLFVHPARVDTFPSAVLEAMATKLPVIATRVGGIPEQVEDGSTGRLVPLGQPRALAEAIATLRDDSAQRASMGRAGRDRVLRCFTLHRQIAAHMEWIREAVESRRQAQGAGT